MKVNFNKIKKRLLIHLKLYFKTNHITHQLNVHIIKQNNHHSQKKDKIKSNQKKEGKKQRPCTMTEHTHSEG